MNMAFARELMTNFTFEGQEKALTLFADDAVFEDFTFGFRVEGMDQLRLLFRDFFDPSKHEHNFTAISYVGDAESGAIEYTWKLRSKAKFMGVPTDGKELTGRGVIVLTFRDGKIAIFNDYWDAAGILRQLGAVQ